MDTKQKPRPNRWGFLFCGKPKRAPLTLCATYGTRILTLGMRPKRKFHTIRIMSDALARKQWRDFAHFVQDLKLSGQPGVLLTARIIRDGTRWFGISFKSFPDLFYSVAPYLLAPFMAFAVFMVLEARSATVTEGAAWWTMLVVTFESYDLRQTFINHAASVGVAWVYLRATIAKHG